jgi:hypothetical protein
MVKAIAALLGLCLSLLAQERMATTGHFLDREGKPVAGAAVTFATSPLLVYDAFAPAEVVHTKTDENGRFRAELRVGVAHSAWAIGPPTKQGWLITETREGVLAGSVLTLRAIALSTTSTLHIDGLERLGDGGPFRLRSHTDARHSPEWVLPVSDTGEFALPREFQKGASLLDAQGKVRIADLNMALGAAYIPEPRRFRCRVLDEKGNALAGARVARVEGLFLGGTNDPFGELREIDTRIESPPTDADGYTELVLHEFVSQLVAFAPGCAQSVTGVMNGQWVQDGKFQTKDARGENGKWPELTMFRLVPAAPVRGRLHRGSEALAGIGVLAKVDVRVTSHEWGGTTTASFQQPCPTVTDANGEFAFDPLPGPIGSLQLAFAPLGNDEPQVLLLPRDARPTAPLDFDLAEWPVTTLQVLDASGGPPSQARCVLQPMAEGNDTPPIVVPTDRAGRVRLRLEPGEWFVFATDADGWAATALVVRAGSGESTTTLRFDPLERRAGIALRADGSPSPGEHFGFGGYKGSPMPKDTPPLEKVLRSRARLLNDGVNRGVRSDQNGRFVLRFYHLPGVEVIGSMGQCPTRIVLEPGPDLELRLNY